MDRRKIIIQEIESWRRNKLLPEHYCLFLLNLYTEGDLQQLEAREEERSFFRKKTGFGIFALLVLLAVVFLGNALLFPGLDRQLWFLGFFLAGMYLITAWVRDKNPYLYHLSLSINSVVVLFGVLWKLNQLGLLDAYFLPALVTVLIWWFVSGILFQVYYLSGVSLAGMLLSFGWRMHVWLVPHYTVWAVQGMWLAISLFLLAAGFLIQGTLPQLVRYFRMTSLLAFFASEVQTYFVLGRITPMLPVFLAAKAIFLAVLIRIVKKYGLFPPRKKDLDLSA